MPRNLVIAIAALTVTLALGACTIQPAYPPQPLYQRLGGDTAIAAIVDDAVANIAADPRINQRFRHTGALHLRKNLVDLFCARTGGPCVYTGRDMSAAHDGMNIRDDEFNALVEDLALSLEKHRVPEAEKRELLAILGQMKNAVIGH